jgi:hypothetical protein
LAPHSNVYIQHRFLDKGKWHKGNLEQIGKWEDIKHLSSGGGFGAFSVPGGIFEMYSMPEGAMIIAGVGGVTYYLWLSIQGYAY